MVDGTTDILGRLYDAATDGELTVLDELAERAGIIWICRRGHGPWSNREDEACGRCGKARG